MLLIQVCSDPPPMHCSTGFGKLHSPLSSAALQNRLTACLCLCSYTYADLLFIQVCSEPPSMHCSTGFGKNCPVLLCNTGSQHACVTAITPMMICSSYKCAVTHHQCTAALVLANCIHHCPVLLCKTGSACLCLCNTYTFMSAVAAAQVLCTDPHTNALQIHQHHCIHHCPVLLCNCNYTGSQHACVTAITPMHDVAITPEKICCSYKCAVTHHQCTAALVLANCIHHCPVLLCKTGSQHACHCNYT